MLNQSPTDLFRPASGYKSFLKLKLMLCSGFSVFLIMLIWGKKPNSNLVKFIESFMDSNAWNIIGFLGLAMAYFGLIFKDLSKYFPFINSISPPIIKLANTTLIYCYQLGIIGISIATGTIFAGIIIIPKTFSHILEFVLFWPLVSGVLLLNFFIWWIAKAVLEQNCADIVKIFLNLPLSRKLVFYSLIGLILSLDSIYFFHTLLYTH